MMRVQWPGGLGLFCMALVGLALAAGGPAYVKTGSLPAPEANQAAAADERFVYAIDNAVVAKYDRASGRRLAASTGEAKHLNSGFLLDGKLYCAHSNYPRKPERSEIRVLDPQTMVLSTFRDFGDSYGSLTWAVRRPDGRWWCTFAFYGEENGKTVLVELDERWKKLGAWTYPPEVVRDLGRMSISGGIWQGDTLLATGHDHRRIYRLRLPKAGSVLELIDTLPSPFPGQGIASDPKTGGLVGIDRAKREVVFAEYRPSLDRAGTGIQKHPDGKKKYGRPSRRSESRVHPDRALPGVARVPSAGEQVIRTPGARSRRLSAWPQRSRWQVTRSGGSSKDPPTSTRH